MTAPNVTALVSPKFPPWMITEVPPLVDPVAGSREVMKGVGLPPTARASESAGSHPLLLEAVSLTTIEKPTSASVTT